jgi:hypothetical protein
LNQSGVTTTLAFALWPFSSNQQETQGHDSKKGTSILKQISPLLQVRDLAASVSFSGQKLGFQTGSMADGFSAIRRDDCIIYLAQKTKDADVTNKAARAVADGWCNYDLHIHCTPGTLDALYQEFRAKGVPMPDCFDDGPVTKPYGVRDFSVIDPDGFDLVFAEPC